MAKSPNGAGEANSERLRSLSFFGKQGRKRGLTEPGGHQIAQAVRGGASLPPAGARYREYPFGESHPLVGLVAEGYLAPPHRRPRRPFGLVVGRLHPFTIQEGEKTVPTREHPPGPGAHLRILAVAVPETAVFHAGAVRVAGLPQWFAVHLLYFKEAMPAGEDRSDLLERVFGEAAGVAASFQ